MNVSMLKIFLIAAVLGWGNNVNAEGGFLCVGGGYPFGLINNVNTAIQNEANTFNGKVDKTASGGSFLVDFTFLATPNDSTAASTFGLMTGYSYHGTSQASATMAGIETQVIKVNLKASIHEIKCEPGLFFQPGSGGVVFLGGGVVYSIINGNVNGLDNEGRNGIMAGSLGSGFGLCGIARYLFFNGSSGSGGLGVQLEITNKNISVGAFIAAF